MVCRSLDGLGLSGFGFWSLVVWNFQPFGNETGFTAEGNSPEHNLASLG